MKTPKRHINRSYNYNKTDEIIASAQSHEIIFNPLSDDQIKISQLPETSGLDGSDLLPVVDISGISLVTKKITLSNFIESTFNTSILPSGDNIKFSFNNNVLYIYTSPTGSFSDLVVSNKTGSGIPVFNNSPDLSGIPTAPTANSGTNNNQIANTSFVRTEIANLVDSAPSTLDTLNELAAALGNDPNYSVTIINQLSNKANLSGASFSGTITSPTGDFVILKQSGILVSVSGHNHTTSDITNFNNSVSGLLPSVTGAGYIISSFDNNTYTINVTGLQPTGNYSLVGHSHLISDISNFASSVSGLLPSVTGTGYVNSLFNNNLYSISVTGLQPSGDYSVTGHSHIISDVSGLQNALDNKQPTGIYASGIHTHTSSEITDFNSSVSGLLPSKYPTVVQLGSVSGTINTDASLGDIFDLILVASGTLANPTNPTDGQSVRWRISHDASGLILDFGDQFRIPSSATSPLPISSTSGSMDILGATYDSSRTKWDIIAFVPGY